MPEEDETSGSRVAKLSSDACGDRAAVKRALKLKDTHWGRSDVNAPVIYIVGDFAEADEEARARDRAHGDPRQQRSHSSEHCSRRRYDDRRQKDVAVECSQSNVVYVSSHQKGASHLESSTRVDGKRSNTNAAKPSTAKSHLPVLHRHLETV